MDWIRYIGPGELMAISSALIAATAHTCIRQGMRTASPFMAALIVNGLVSLGGLTFSLYWGTLQTQRLHPSFGSWPWGLPVRGLAESPVS